MHTYISKHECMHTPAYYYCSIYFYSNYNKFSGVWLENIWCFGMHRGTHFKHLRSKRLFNFFFRVFFSSFSYIHTSIEILYSCCLLDVGVYIVSIVCVLYGNGNCKILRLRMSTRCLFTESKDKKVINLKEN